MSCLSDVNAFGKINTKKSLFSNVLQELVIPRYGFICLLPGTPPSWCIRCLTLPLENRTCHNLLQLQHKALTPSCCNRDTCGLCSCWLIRFLPHFSALFRILFGPILPGLVLSCFVCTLPTKPIVSEICCHTFFIQPNFAFAAFSHLQLSSGL